MIVPIHQVIYQNKTEMIGFFLPVINIEINQEIKQTFNAIICVFIFHSF